MRTTSSIFAVLALAGLFACSTETVVVKGGAGQGGDPSGTENGDPSGEGPGADPTNPDAPRAPLASGISVRDVALFQGTKVQLVKDGALAKTTTAVVAGRPALVRVYVKPDDATAREVTAELRIEAGDKKHPLLRETKTIAKASTDEDTKSTFNFEVPAAYLTTDATFSVALTAADGTPVDESENAARFPADGLQQSMTVKAVGKLKVVVVPVKYDVDGSGRMPDVSEAQMKLYKDTMMARYPVTDVEITVHAPLSWTRAIAPNGSGFSQVLSSITNLRGQEGAAKDVYYYGIFSPAASFNSYCQGGCVTGLSTVVESVQVASMRASVGVGFSGPDAANTMAHEVGHAHGREHAPCGGARGSDPEFPYSNGSIGTWGYDIVTKKLYNPTKSFDMMGYCENEWVSDYTFRALFERVSGVNKLAGTSTSGGGGQREATPVGSARLAVVDADGAMTWTTEPFVSDALAGGDARTISYHDRAGLELGKATARFYRFDHLPGGVLVVPESAAAKTANWSHAKVAGFSRTLAR